MHKTLKSILLVFVLATYLIAANGIVVQYAATWFSGGGESTVAMFKGPVRELPRLTTNERTHLPLNEVIVLVAIALLVQTLLFPSLRAFTGIRFIEPLASRQALLFSVFGNKAPPTA